MQEKSLEEKILNIIKQVDLREYQHQNLSNSSAILEAISKIIIKEEKISFVINLDILEIDLEKGKVLLEEIKKQIKKVTNFAVNIALTSEKQQIMPKNQHNFTSKLNNKTSSIKGVQNIIAVASGKGGVGKSTVAVNLAISLGRIGYNVGLIDADIYGPSVAYLMNLQGKPESVGNLMIPIKNYGVNCISVGSIISPDKATIWRGPMVSKVLNQLIAGTSWVDIDYLIVDLPPGTGDVALSIMQQFKPTAVVLVSTPQNLAVIDVVKAVDMFKTLQVPILGVIQNMAYLEDKNGNKNYIFGENSAKKMAQNLGLNFLGDIAIDSAIGNANDAQNPISNLHPSNQISMQFGIIAENIADLLKV